MDIYIVYYMYRYCIIDYHIWNKSEVFPQFMLKLNLKVLEKSAGKVTFVPQKLRDQKSKIFVYKKWFINNEFH